MLKYAVGLVFLSHSCQFEVRCTLSRPANVEDLELESCNDGTSLVEARRNVVAKVDYNNVVSRLRRARSYEKLHLL
jgi:hypothetical protein